MKTKHKLFQRAEGGRESVISLQKQRHRIPHTTTPTPPTPFFTIPAPEKEHVPELPQSAFPLNVPDLQGASKGGRFPLIPKLPLPPSRMAAP